MQKRQGQAHPPRSVDNALRLIGLLRDRGELRVSDAAAELGVAASTAHRLLEALVAHGWAKQADANRPYLLGPTAYATPLNQHPRLRELQHLLTPHLERLCHHVGESVNLVVRAGTDTRFLTTVEAIQRVLHVGDRQGTILPAHKSSGGKALLAELSDGHLTGLYAQGPQPILTPGELAHLTHELAQIRQRGYALNWEATETGVCAIGRVVRDRSRSGIAAVTIAVPTVRFRDEMNTLIPALVAVTDRATQDLAAG